jgi:HAD superfamily hydrolase (TIGR01509 family)
MIKTILFDNNGVVTFSDDEMTVPRLAEFFKIDVETLRPIFHEFSKDMDAGLITSKRCYQKVAKYFDREYTDEVMDLVLKCYEPRPGMKELLQDIKKDYEIAMLTNFGDIFDDLNKRTWHFEEIFDEEKIFVSAKIHLIKPDEEFFLYALEKLGRNPEEVVFVDDRESNINPARKLGFNTIIFRDFEQFKNELKLITEKSRV